MFIVQSGQLSFFIFIIYLFNKLTPLWCRQFVKNTENKSMFTILLFHILDVKLD